MTLIQIIGVAVGAYAIYAASVGRALGGANISPRFVSRSIEPAYFWVLVAIYAGLSMALIFLF